MKRVKKRAVAVLVLVAAAVLGTVIFTVSYIINGGSWATQRFNQSVYTNGVLSRGVVLDRNGVVLADVDDETGSRIYADDATVRISTLHAVGDAQGNIGTGVLNAFSSELIGYNIITGTYSRTGKGDEIYLTIDSELNAVAYEALAGRKGTVAVFNYNTGEILCMVSSPSYDPEDPPEISDDDTEYEGVYINRFLSSSYVPGSIFKLVTLAAAIENIDDLYDRSFVCTGSVQIGGETISCTGSHGTQTIESALANSCNVAFAELAVELGSQIIYQYAENYGLLDSMSINGITTAAGNFDISESESGSLAWSGIGQSTDTVNPCSMLRFIGAIANGGIAVNMTLLCDGYDTDETRIMDEDTANKIASMMSYNVSAQYGASNFPGLNICAKSGTAEVGGDVSPHAWFTGFLDDDEYPLAFIVLVENGGWGTSVAGTIANTVLQAAVTR